MKLFCYSLLLCVVVCPVLWAKGPKISDPKEVDADYQFQGEYVGELQVEGSAQKFGAQLIALGNGEFKSVAYFGGLPGAGWDSETKFEAEGKRDGEQVIIDGEHAKAFSDGKRLKVISDEGEELGTLEKTVRKSPTLGKKPPQGAVVLFDGKSAEKWKNGKIENELLVEGTTSKPTFQSHTLHIEFRLPYQPEDRGQGRGNSGIYLQGRYEVQMLDSFGLGGEHNECGGIYSIKKPDVNMCLPPLVWQTYDIDFTAAKYDDEGKVVQHPKMTVKHNGVVIHKDVELKKSTTAAPVKPGTDPGPVYLQNHACPVRYRNVWVVEK